jgi:hypothetical protein
MNLKKLIKKITSHIDVQSLEIINLKDDTEPFPKTEQPEMKVE